MAVQSMTLYGKFPGMNEIVAAAKSHYGAYSKMKRELTTSVAVMALTLKPVQPPLRVRFLWYEPDRRRDPDNISAGGRKFILDGLVEGKIIPTDGWTLYEPTGGLEDRFYIDKDNPRVVVELIEEPEYG